MDAALVPADYVRAVERSGGAPLLVPPGATWTRRWPSSTGWSSPAARTSILSCTATDAHPETNGVVRERDDFELELMRAALARDVPMLAICRGSQVLNVALGGGIEQHVPDRVGTEVHKRDAGCVRRARRGRGAGHASRVELLGERHDVKSHHHQGFGELGDGLREAARAPDGTIEALEDPSRRFTLGVLWHPEAGEDAALFDALVAEATAYAAAKQ